MILSINTNFNPEQTFDKALTEILSYCCLNFLSTRANEEIAQVRAKSNAESVALNASLRKEQMKVDSLERAVLQKVRWDASMTVFHSINVSI